MIFDIEWTSEAQRDFASIDDFYAEIAPDYATRVGRLALKAAIYLAQHPTIGSLIDDSDYVRKWRVGRTAFLLIYRVKGSRLQILRIRHMAENWKEGAL